MTPRSTTNSPNPADTVAGLWPGLRRYRWARSPAFWASLGRWRRHQRSPLKNYRQAESSDGGMTCDLKVNPELPGRTPGIVGYRFGAWKYRMFCYFTYAVHIIAIRFHGKFQMQAGLPLEGWIYSFMFKPGHLQAPPRYGDMGLVNYLICLSIGTRPLQGMFKRNHSKAWIF